MLNYETGKLIEGRENLIFIHGLGGNTRNWEKQIELEEKYNLYFIDLQGFGKSEIYKSMSLKNHALLVRKTLESIKLKNYHLIGLSMGGLVVQEIMKTKNNKVKSISLISTYEKLDKRTKIEFERRTIRRIIENDTKGMVERYFYDKENRENILQIKRGNKYTKDTYLSSARNASFADYEDDNKNLKINCLIISGDKDELIDSKYSRKLNKKIKGSNLEILENCGHLPNIEKSEEFNNLLINFIDSL